jgi:hypothetical protein
MIAEISKNLSTIDNNKEGERNSTSSRIPNILRNSRRFVEGEAFNFQTPREGEIHIIMTNLAKLQEKSKSKISDIFVRSRLSTARVLLSCLDSKPQNV